MRATFVRTRVCLAMSDEMYDTDSDVGELEPEEEEEDGFIGGPFSGPDGEQAVVTQRSKEPVYQVLTPDTLSKKMFEIVDEVNAVFQVSLFRAEEGSRYRSFHFLNFPFAASDALRPYTVDHLQVGQGEVAGKV